MKAVLPFGVLERLRQAITRAEDPKSGLCDLQSELKELLFEAESVAIGQRDFKTMNVREVLKRFNTLMKEVNRFGK